MKKLIFSYLLMAIASVCVFSSCSKDDDDAPRSTITNLDNGYISSDLLRGTWKTGNDSRYKLMVFTTPGTFTLVDYVDGQETGRSEAIYTIDKDNVKLFKYSFSTVVANNHWDNVQYLIWQNDSRTQFVLSYSSNGDNGTLYIKQ
jgi:hypothetical protein